MDTTVILQVLIIAAGAAGFLVADHIRRGKSSKKTLACPFKTKCDPVVRSEYAWFLGIPVEFMGLVFYAIVVLSYSLMLVWPGTAPGLLTFTVIVFATVAFLFSLYLTFIQLFNLKQWCSWCLISTGLCVVIFVSAIAASELGFIALLVKYHSFILLVNFLGLALGVGGVTLANVFFFKFLADFKIASWEEKVMRTVIQFIWFSLAVFVVSGIGLYFPSPDLLREVPSVLAKIIAVIVIIINGALLDLLILPRLTGISVHGKHKHKPGELHHMRKTAFSMGLVSLVSWYYVFILTVFTFRAVGSAALVLIYLALIASALVAGRVIEARA